MRSGWSFCCSGHTKINLRWPIHRQISSDFLDWGLLVHILVVLSKSWIRAKPKNTVVTTCSDDTNIDTNRTNLQQFLAWNERLFLNLTVVQEHASYPMKTASIVFPKCDFQHNFEFVGHAFQRNIDRTMTWFPIVQIAP